MVMVALFVASLVIGVMVRTALLQQRQIVLNRDQVQAFWLAEAGLQLAARQASAPADQPGGAETNILWKWTPAGSETSQPPRKSGEVTIHISGEDDQRPTVVIADFPADSIHRVRARRELSLSPATGSPGTPPQPISALQPENRQP